MLLLKKLGYLKNSHTAESGATFFEYAMLAALIAMVAVAALGVLGTEASVSFSGAGSFLKNQNTSFAPN